MAIEIERKFLLASDDWRALVTHSERMAQAYLTRQDADQRCSVRVRIAGQGATLNIKSADKGRARQEFEYPIPLGDAEALMALAGGAVIDKLRHYVPWGELTWEIDEFHGVNAGLIVAEIELPRIDTHFERPAWLALEVTSELRYYNSALAEHPYTAWSAST